MHGHLSTDNRELLKAMFQKETNTIDPEMDFIYGKAKRLRDLANTLGLNEVAEEINRDYSEFIYD